MTRPAYETATHRAAQAKLALALERHFGIKLKPLKNAHYSLDYFACDAKTRVGRGWVELKCRNTRWGQYDAVMISAGKWRDGVTLAESTGLPFGLWFEFADGSVHGYVYDPKHVGSPADQSVRAQADTTKLLLPYGQQEVDKNGLWSDGKLWVRPGVWLEWGGRTRDERDDADAEPVVMIANSLWEPLSLDRSELDVPPGGDPAPVEQPRVDDSASKEDPEPPAPNDDYPF